jgi:transcription elongation GreA/GreB family factor
LPSPISGVAPQGYSSLGVSRRDKGWGRDQTDHHLEMASMTTVTQPHIQFGSTVSFTDERTGSLETFTIVEPHRSKPAEGRLSGESPVGRALLGRHVGDLVEVHIPKGIRRLMIAAVV